MKAWPDEREGTDETDIVFPTRVLPHADELEIDFTYWRKKIALKFISYMGPDLWSGYVINTADAILIQRIGGALGPVNLLNLGNDILAPLWEPTMDVSELHGKILALDEITDQAEIKHHQRKIARVLHCSIILGTGSATLLLMPWFLSFGPLLTATGYTDCVNPNATFTNTTSCLTIADASQSYTSASALGAVFYVGFSQLYNTGSATGMGHWFTGVKMLGSMLGIGIGAALTYAGYIEGPGWGQSIMYGTCLLASCALFTCHPSYEDYGFSTLRDPAYPLELKQTARNLFSGNLSYCFITLIKYYSPLFLAAIDVNNEEALGFYTTAMQAHLYTLAGNGATASRIEKEIQKFTVLAHKNKLLPFEEAYFDLNRKLRRSVKKIVIYNTGFSVCLTGIPFTVYVIPATNQLVIRFYNVWGTPLSENTMRVASRLFQSLAVILPFLSVEEVFSNALRAIDSENYRCNAISLGISTVGAGINVAATCVSHIALQLEPYHTVLIAMTTAMLFSTVLKGIMSFKAIRTLTIDLTKPLAAAPPDIVTESTRLLTQEKSQTSKPSRCCGGGLYRVSQAISGFFCGRRGLSTSDNELGDRDTYTWRK